MRRAGATFERPTIETLIASGANAPLYRESGDLEAATKTIIETVKPAVGAAQYSKTSAFGLVGLIALSADARFTLYHIAAQLVVTIDNLATSPVLNYALVCVQDDVDHTVLSGSWNSTGQKIVAIDMNAASIPVVFALLKGGVHRNWYVLLDCANGDVVVSECRINYGVGRVNDTAYYGADYVWKYACGDCKLSMRGIIHARIGVGSGNARAVLVSPATGTAISSEQEADIPANTGAAAASAWNMTTAPVRELIVKDSIALKVGGCTVATDVWAAQTLGFVIKRD